MKILLINTVPTEKNGITNVIYNYLRNIDRKEMTFDYLSINEPETSYREEMEKLGGRMFVLSRLDMNVFLYWNALRKLIKQNCYDAVHVHGNSHTLILELSAAWLAGCKVRIVHSHNTTCINPLLHKILFPVFNLLYTHALACGKEAGLWMFGSRTYTVINNGVDIRKYSFDIEKRKSIRQQLCISDDEILIGNVGHFYGQVKNQSFVVNILNELLKRSDRYKLSLIGDGPQRKDVEQQVGDYEISDRVIFTGNINNVDEYLCAIDMIVMPSLFEGLPLTLIEQQACGLHCVVADTITKEADKTGNLKFLSLGSPIEEWVNCIEKSEVEIEREKCSKAAIEKITEAGYNIAVEANKLRNVYECINKTL